MIHCRLDESKAVFTNIFCVLELFNNFWKRSACRVLVFYVPSWNNGACHIRPFTYHASSRLVARLVVNSLFEHKALLLCIKISLADHPRVCIGDSADLTVEGILKCLLDWGQTATSCRVGHNWYSIESGVFDVLVPYKNSVFIHARATWNHSTCRGIARIVRVHNKHWDVQVLTDGQERKHWPKV